jgi:hypothetical protein
MKLLLIGEFFHAFDDVARDGKVTHEFREFDHFLDRASDVGNQEF